MTAQLSPQTLAACLGRASEGFPEAALKELVTYVSMLLRWNKIMNLTGASDWEECARTLIADCGYLVPFMRSLALPEDCEVWDPGAGAGLPGIPLRLAWKQGRYTMIEIRKKRAMFLSQCVGTLGLESTFVHAGDIRAFASGRRPADCIVSRAFMPWEKLLALAEELTAPSGVVVFMASEPCPCGELPAGWRPEKETSYPYGKGVRHLWAVRRGAQ